MEFDRREPECVEIKTASNLQKILEENSFVPFRTLPSEDPRIRSTDGLQVVKLLPLFQMSAKAAMQIKAQSYTDQEIWKVLETMKDASHQSLILFSSSIDTTDNSSSMSFAGLSPDKVVIGRGELTLEHIPMNEVRSILKLQCDPENTIVIGSEAVPDRYVVWERDCSSRGQVAERRVAINKGFVLQDSGAGTDIEHMDIAEMLRWLNKPDFIKRLNIFEEHKCIERRRGMGFDAVLLSDEFEELPDWFGE